MTEHNGKPREWAWIEDGHETANGPFGSREEAVRDAEKKAAGPYEIGWCDWPDPARFAKLAADADTLVETMDELAADNEYWGDDPFFDLRPGAQEALERVLAQWAKKYVVGSSTWTFRLEAESKEKQ